MTCNLTVAYNTPVRTIRVRPQTAFRFRKELGRRFFRTYTKTAVPLRAVRLTSNPERGKFNHPQPRDAVMAKLKLNRDLIKILLPVVVPIAKDLAAKTETKIDDKIVSALEVALSNPIVLEMLLSMLAGEDDVTPPVASLSDEAAEAVDTLRGNEALVGALFSIAKAE